MRYGLIEVVAAVSLCAAALAAQDQNAARQALIARGNSLELNTPYVPVPGDPLEHHAAGYATIMCSGVFITGLDPAFVAENIGYFTAPYESRAQLGTPKVDRANRAVSVTMPTAPCEWRSKLGARDAWHSRSARLSLNSNLSL